MRVKYLFVTGMFRSGTTLLARSLGAHPKIISASDPYFEFFKHIRNIFYGNIFAKLHDPKSPLDDNFLKLPFLKSDFRNAFPDIYFNNEDIKTLINNVK